MAEILDHLIDRGVMAEIFEVTEMTIKRWSEILDPITVVLPGHLDRNAIRFNLNKVEQWGHDHGKEMPGLDAVLKRHGLKPRGNLKKAKRERVRLPTA